MDTLGRQPAASTTVSEVGSLCDVRSPEGNVSTFDFRPKYRASLAARQEPQWSLGSEARRWDHFWR